MADKKIDYNQVRSDASRIIAMLKAMTGAEEVLQAAEQAEGMVPLLTKQVADLEAKHKEAVARAEESEARLKKAVADHENAQQTMTRNYKVMVDERNTEIAELDKVIEAKRKALAEFQAKLENTIKAASSGLS
jgi:flagellar motility protein MotE (MotC chaperone)